ncbi:MAG: hypothetical protein LBP87_03975, partial [Planctomycetaceae bacterium]|nr:hypothetical protein [Planctomycetaceae bacterium]
MKVRFFHGFTFVVITIIILLIALLLPAVQAAHEVETELAGFNPVVLQRIDTIVERAIVAKKMPGCVVCIGRS